MRIAFVVHDYRRADVGQTRYVRELAGRFSRNHEVHIFANRIETDGNENIRFHYVPAWRKNALTGLLSFALSSSLRIRRDFDIIHTQGFCGFYGNVISAHICNRAWHKALRDIEGRLTAREWIFNAFATALEYRTYRFARSSAVIAVSGKVAYDIRDIYHCPAPIHVIHHGVNVDLFSPANCADLRTEMRHHLGLNDSDFLFLFVGNLRKGADRCIRALAKLTDGRLLCVSRTGPARARALADQLELGDRVRFLSFTESIAAIYAAGDALVLPSPYDAFGMVATEAMAAGLPVIVSREAGVSELIQNGSNGLLINDVRDPAELADLMQSLQEKRCWAESMGRAGRETAEALLWDVVADRTMAVYEDVRALNKSTCAETRASHEMLS